MTFPVVTTVTDTFDRADERPLTGGSWEALGVAGQTATAELLAVTSNVLQGPASAGWASQHWTGVAGPDVESYLKVTTKAAVNSRQMGLYVRLQGGGTATPDGYALVITISGSFPLHYNLKIFRVDDGVLTQLGASAATSLSGSPVQDMLGVECEGDAIRGYWYSSVGLFWSQRLERTDATYPEAGTAAIEVENQVARNDDWVYGTKVPFTQGRPQLIQRLEKGFPQGG